MKHLMAILTLALTFTLAFGQSPCLDPMIRTGAVITMTVRDHSKEKKPAPSKKAPPEEKRRIVEDYNRSVATGTNPNGIVTNLTYKVLDERKLDNFCEYKMEYRMMSPHASVGEVVYTGSIAMSADSMMLLLHEGPWESKYENTVVGMLNFYPVYFPRNMEVGMRIPYSVFNYYLSVPSEVEYATFRQAVVDKTTTYEWGKHNTFVTGWGNVQSDALYKKTTYTIEHIAATVKTSVKMGNLRYTHVGAEVTDIQDYTFQGKTYKAYIISGFDYMRAGLNVDVQSADAAIAARERKHSERAINKINRKMLDYMEEAGFDNADGFIVIPTEEWYVPELGIVRSIAYDSKGFIYYHQEYSSIQ